MSISTGFLSFLIIFSLLVGVLLGFLAGKIRSNSLIASGERHLQASQAEKLRLNGKLEQLKIEKQDWQARYQTDQEILERFMPLYTQLQEVNKRVHHLNEYTAAQDAKLLSHLEESIRTGAEISRTTASLQATLQSNSARGNWGEVQLRRIIEAAGMLEHVDFDIQKSSGNFSSSLSAKNAGEKRSLQRPDALLHLPDNAHLAIDAKVPLSAYLRAQDLPEQAPQAQRQKLLEMHAKALRGHIAELVKRNYPGDFPTSPQITILFLPSEALLSQALLADVTLLEDALRQGIVLTSPSSLLALLKAAASVWSMAASSAEAKEIADLGRTLVERLTTMAKHLEKLGDRLGDSVKQYNMTIGSLENRVLVTARKFSALKTASSELPETLLPIAAENAQLRSLQTDEFKELEKKKIHNDLDSQ